MTPSKARANSSMKDLSYDDDQEYNDRGKSFKDEYVDRYYTT